MNYDNKNESVIKNITNDIKQNFCKNECKDIGKKWTKKCPICSKIQNYKNSRSFWNAKKINAICLSCKNTGKNNPFYGKKHTRSFKNKISKVQKTKGSFRYKKFGGNPEKIEKICNCCNKQYYVIKSRSLSKYCTYKCALIDNFGFKYNKMTKPEMYVKDYLESNNIKFKYNYELCGKLYDFYIPSIKTLIEVDGIYWHGKNKNLDEMDKAQLRSYKNDKIKTRLAKKFGYNLIRIWEDEIKNVSKYIH